jgi:hypothetical protein
LRRGNILQVSSAEKSRKRLGEVGSESVLLFHQAQPLSCLNFSGRDVGFFINFKAEHLKDGNI